MSRYTDTDALIADITERYCKDCNKRRGMKNGKLRTIYEIGEAPCRACDVDDMKSELDNAPTTDVVPVVRCKNCKYYAIYELKHDGTDDMRYKPSVCIKGKYSVYRKPDWYCADGKAKV